MWNLNFKRNETNETKQTNETQTILSVCAMLLVLQLGFYLSVCQLASAVFCENDLLKGSCKTTETGSFPEHLHVCQSI